MNPQDAMWVLIVVVWCLIGLLTAVRWRVKSGHRQRLGMWFMTIVLGPMPLMMWIAERRF